MTSPISPYSTLQDRIQAVLAKDKNASASFVVAIISQDSSPAQLSETSDPIKGLTKSHCRPDCINIPKNISPDNLRFFDSSEDALNNNFKPCLLCHPDLPVRVSPSLIQSTVNAVNASLNIDIRAVPITESPETDLHSISSNSISNTTTNPSIYSSSSSTTIPENAQFDGPECAISSNSASPDDSTLVSRNFHHRAPSLANSPSDSEDREFWMTRPRRASIANGHIHVVATAVDEINKLEGNNSPAFNIVPLNQPQFLPHTSAPNGNYPHQPVSSPESQSAPRARHSGYAAKRKDERQSRGEGEHARLVSEACIHIAAAAAAAAAQAASEDTGVVESGRRRSPSMVRSASLDPSRRSFKPQRKKRRGGILGFKELAAKAGLSPWHFHRVFRSVTGLTPKAYGDACWNTVTSLSPEDLLNKQAGNKFSPPIPSPNLPNSISHPLPDSSLPAHTRTLSASHGHRHNLSLPGTVVSRDAPPISTSVGDPMAGLVTNTSQHPIANNQTISPSLSFVNQHISQPFAGGTQPNFGHLPNQNTLFNYAGPFNPEESPKNFNPVQHFQQPVFPAPFPVDDTSFDSVQTWPEVNNLNVLHEVPNIDNIPDMSHIGESLISSLEPPMYMMNLAGNSTVATVDSVAAVSNAVPVSAADSLAMSADSTLSSSPFIQHGFTPAHLSTLNTPPATTGDGNMMMPHLPNNNVALSAMGMQPHISMSANSTSVVATPSPPMATLTSNSGSGTNIDDCVSEFAKDLGPVEDIFGAANLPVAVNPTKSNEAAMFHVAGLDNHNVPHADFHLMTASLETPVFESHGFNFEDTILEDTKAGDMGANKDTLLMDSHMVASMDAPIFGNEFPHTHHPSAVLPSSSMHNYVPGAVNPNMVANSQQNVMGLHPSASQFLSLPTNGANTPVMLDDSLVGAYY